MKKEEDQVTDTNKPIQRCCTPEKLMFKESRSKFDFQTTVHKIREAFLKDWLIPWETNIQERYWDEGYSDMTKATIIPICRPEGGYNIIKHDPYKLITPLMPLQISVYEKSDGKVYVSRMRVKMMSMLMSSTTRKNMKYSGIFMEKTLEDILL